MHNCTTEVVHSVADNYGNNNNDNRILIAAVTLMNILELPRFKLSELLGFYSPAWLAVTSHFWQSFLCSVRYV